MPNREDLHIFTFDAIKDAIYAMPPAVEELAYIFLAKGRLRNEGAPIGELSKALDSVAQAV